MSERPWTTHDSRELYLIDKWGAPYFAVNARGNLCFRPRPDGGGDAAAGGDAAGVIHGGVGKASFEPSALVENVKAFVQAVNRAKPAGAKGTYLKKISLSSTMGPGVTVDVANAVGE